jgi:drug/metabolite transporter (DMT)-like permease
MGPLFGGAIVTWTSWRWIFLINVPFALIAIALALLFVEEHREPGPSRPFDARGFMLLALGMTASFALVIIIPRINPGVPSLPPTVVSAFLTLAIFAPFGSVGSLDLHNWIVLAAFGATNFSLALVLFLAGAKRMPPAEAALIGTIEIVLTPFWVWLLFSEQPPIATFFGGAIILGAVLWHTAIDFNRSRRPHRA